MPNTITSPQTNYKTHTMLFTNTNLLSLQPLVALLALVNPIAIVPFFIHYTQGLSTVQRQKTVYIICFTVLLVFVCCALLGLRILGFFGISLASFQVGGGVLLMLSALSMLNAQHAEAKTHEAEETNHSASQTSVAVVPLAIPLLAGPASMSAMVIFANQTENMLQMLQLIVYAILVAIAVYISCTLSRRIAKAMGSTGINIMTRLMGLVLTAMSIEVISEGLKKIFPILAG